MGLFESDDYLTPRSNSYHGGGSRGVSPARSTRSARSTKPNGAFVRPAASGSGRNTRPASGASFFGNVGGGGSSRGIFGSSSSGSSYYKRRPRDGYIKSLLHKLQRMIKDLWAYARRHPVKAFFAVVVPMLSAGGAIGGILKQFGFRLPMGLGGALGMGGMARKMGGGYYGSEGYGDLRDLGGLGGAGFMEGAGSLFQVAKMFIAHILQAASTDALLQDLITPLPAEYQDRSDGTHEDDHWTQYHQAWKKISQSRRMDRATHVWPELDRTDPTGFTLRRWMNPLRPLPPLSIVLIFNPPSSTAARSLATKFADDFPAYAHLHIPEYLCNLRGQMQTAVSQKLFGDLHPSAFISFIDKHTDPTDHFLIDIIKRAFEVEGRHNPRHRKWVITGLPAEWRFVAKFRHVICEPMATVFFTPPGLHPDQSMMELYYDFVDRGARPFWLEDDENEAYTRLLWAITDHAVRGGLLVSSRVTSDEPQPDFAGEGMVEIDTQTGPSETTELSEATSNGQDTDDTVERETDVDVQTARGRDSPMEQK
ncbi:hypothetical protein TI39_contig289g00019 [Zymoseptoria brevis]|uniref:Uncharacterized protein n=1 Tax=Zymoseptoria brevis TaxID=1047168 RepID=A0A0F4GVW3_9PEZI|nr:hypothetical protein TI39_contig289g00019 [Zymoseptoria brevis]